MACVQDVHGEVRLCGGIGCFLHYAPADKCGLCGLLPETSDISAPNLPVMMEADITLFRLPYWRPECYWGMSASGQYGLTELQVHRI